MSVADKNVAVRLALDTIAGYCLDAHQLARDNDMAALAARLESVLLDIGKRLAMLEQAAAENHPDGAASAKDHDR